jgi:hypothetical protein
MPAHTVDEILARMQELDATLDANDGVRWFNRLYLEVTLAVKDYLVGRPLEAPPFLERLDVFFGNAYLHAFDAAAAGRDVPAPWAPLFDARLDRRIAPLQFGIAGMNAHINHDLAVGVVATCRELDVEPDDDSPQHRDYDAVNVILHEIEGRVKKWLLTGAVKELDHVVAPVDDAAAIWSIERARDAAWVRAEVMWTLRNHRTLTAAYLAVHGRAVGMEGRAFLLPHLV